LKTAALLSLLAALLVPVSASAAEIKLPQASPGASVSRMIGTTMVRIDYHSPGVRERTIWGGLVPYDEVWRLGANEATTISLSHPVTVEGRKVPAGKYALFAVPGRQSWTMILNRKADQWGAFFYQAKDDLMRFDVRPVAGTHTEWMAFTIDTKTPESAVVELAWEKLRVSFTIDVDVSDIVWASIDSALADRAANWETWHQAARYSLDTGERTAEALKWIDRAMALEETFWNHEVKARLLHREGRTREALPLIDQAMKLALGKAPQGYLDGLAQTRQEWESDQGGR
jgi:hypothetical protein